MDWLPSSLEMQSMAFLSLSQACTRDENKPTKFPAGGKNQADSKRIKIEK